MSEIPHGTASGYGHHRCRCADCKAYKAGEQRALRAKKATARMLAPHPFVPGGKCRCDNCGHARKQAALERNKRYYRDNRSNKLEYRRSYYLEHAAAARQYAKEYRAQHGDTRTREQRAIKSRRRRALKASAPSIRFTPAELAARLSYWGGRCWVCGGSGEAVDHVKPLAAGGADALCNLRPICNRCNSSKGAKWPFEPAPQQAAYAVSGLLDVIEDAS